MNNQPDSATDPTREKQEERKKRHSIVVLECPKCDASMPTFRDASDPDGTKFVRFACPKCQPDGFESIEYLDEHRARLTQ